MNRGIEMNFNNNNEWKSYVTDAIITALVVITYSATLGFSLTV